MRKTAAEIAHSLSCCKDLFVSRSSKRQLLQSPELVAVGVKRNCGTFLLNESALSDPAAGNAGALSDRAEQNASQDQSPCVSISSIRVIVFHPHTCCSQLLNCSAELAPDHWFVGAGQSTLQFEYHNHLWWRKLLCCDVAVFCVAFSEIDNSKACVTLNS